MNLKRYICLVAVLATFGISEACYGQDEPFKTRLFKTNDLEKEGAFREPEKLLLGQKQPSSEPTRDGFVELKALQWNENECPWLYEGDLRDIIERFVEPMSWKDAQAGIRRVKNGLLATNRVVVLDKVQSFLDDIREGRKARVRILTKIVEIKRQQGVAQQFVPVVGQFIDEKQKTALQLALKSRKAVLLNAKDVTAGDGDYRVVKQLKAHRYLESFSIYQGGTVPVNEVDNGVLLEGLQVQLRVAIPRDRSVAQIDCLVERSKKTGMKNRVFKGVGTLQLPEIDVLRAASTFRMKPSQSARTMVLATFSSKSRRSQIAVLIEVQTLFKERTEQKIKAHMAFPLQYYKSPANFKFDFPWRGGAFGPDEFDGSGLAFDDEDESYDVLKSGIAASSMLKSNFVFWNRSLLVRGPKSVKLAARDWLAIQKPSEHRYSYRLLEVDVANEELPEDRVVKPEKVKYWLTRAANREMAGSGYLGQQVSLSWHSELRILSDVEHVSGGTGKEVRQVAMARLSSVGRGQLLIVKALSQTKTGLRMRIEFQSSDYESVKVEDVHGYKVDCPQEWKRIRKSGVHRLAFEHGVVLSVSRGEKRSRAVVLILRSLGS
ncbi:MAG: hypothetical protein P1V97_15215 [Planctomycetota bacterium]|nr:hypothetical protein [Planctomycetota bacterium]